MAWMEAAVGKSYFLLLTESLEHTDGAPVDEVADEHSELNWARAALFSVLDPELELEHSLNLSRSINEVLEESVFIIFEEHLPSL